MGSVYCFFVERQRIQVRCPKSHKGFEAEAEAVTERGKAEDDQSNWIEGLSEG